MDAQERAEDRKLFSASDVAHAEQAAREKALEEAACFVEEQAKIWWRSHNDNSTDIWLAIDDVAKAIRALKEGV